VALLAHPPGCRTCVLDEIGEGFAPADGPSESWLLLVGEALGKVEALTGRPFMGDAGGMLTRLLNLLGWKREAIRIHNVISCRPPNDWYDERAPWYYQAMGHCPYLGQTLAEGHQVVVPMGMSALRRVLHLEHRKKIRVQDFHGSILRDPTDRFWVVPTYHPSFLQRGASNLIGVVLWDLLRAEHARDHGKPADNASLVIDPPVDWFRAWVDQVVQARQQDPGAYPISSDVETPDKAGGKDEGEITAEDRSMQLLRHNVACHPDEGVTVPHAGPFLDELKRLYASPGVIWMWNREYDFKRQVHAQLLREEDSTKVVDLMWLWKVLQSDVPRGLGFVAPFYSSFGPWKHLADEDPARYGAIDGLQNHRVGFGIIGDLVQSGQYRIAMRHTHELLTKVLRPAQLVGVKVDRTRLTVFKQELADKARERLQTLQDCIPEALRPLTPKGGLRRRPAADVLHVRASAFTRRGKVRAGKPTPEIKQELYAKAQVVEKVIDREVLVCTLCGAADCDRRHRCADRRDADAVGAGLEIRSVPVRRWYWREPFNPDSVPQVLAYLKHRKHRAGRLKGKETGESTNRETLERLARTTGDPFYAALLDYRAIGKVKGTYVEGTERRLDSDDRLHPVPTFKPSTMRLSYVDPNITNVVADKDEGRNLAAGFRKCIVASPGCRLLEVDFAGIEAVETGVCARDAEYYRLAKLGVHGALVTHVIGQPYDPAASDDELRALFKKAKREHPEVYDPAKRYIHGRAYGLSVPGMVLQFPHLFPTQATAERYARIYRGMAPKVDGWQKTTQERASRQHYLGGAGDHPFGYKHWFWSVYSYKRLSAAQYYRLVAKFHRVGQEPPIVTINGQHFKVSLGEDGKRVLAFYPQSISSGILKEALLRLLADPDSPSYIGNAYYGRTPLRAPVHDSGLFEIPHRVWDRTYERICMEFQRPVIEQPLPAEWNRPGEFVTIGIAAKAGQDWATMEDLVVPGYDSAWVGEPIEDEDVDDWGDLARVIA